MKKLNYAFMLIAGIFLIAFSYILDEKVNLSLKNLRYQLLDIPLSIITNFSVVVLVMLAIPSIMLYKKNKNSAYMLWAAFIISFISAFAVKMIVSRQRPMGEFYYPFTAIADYSFPSMHSMIAFALLPILIKYLPKQKIFWISFAFLVAFSRLYFSFHFLSDVVFGAIFGYAIGHFLLKYLKEKIKKFS